MIVSLWLVPSGVNGVSSKLCPAHFTHVEIAIFGFLLFAELHFKYHSTMAGLQATGPAGHFHL
jgi:hypothetical protein